MGVISNSAALLVLLGACLDPRVQTYAPWALQLLSSWDAQSRDYDDRSEDAPADGGGDLHHPPCVCRCVQPPAATATSGVVVALSALGGAVLLGFGLAWFGRPAVVVGTPAIPQPCLVCLAYRHAPPATPAAAAAPVSSGRSDGDSSPSPRPGALAHLAVDPLEFGRDASVYRPRQPLA